MKRMTLALFGAACTILSGAATAQSSLLDDKLVFSVGGYLFSTDVQANVNGRSINNPQVDFDKEFGLGSDTNRLRFDGLWRITPNHHLRFLYFDNKRTSSRTTSRDIRWDDVLYTAGVQVDAELRFSIAELAYEYAFARSPTYEVAGSIGVHYIDLSLQLAGQGSVVDSNGNTLQRQFQSRTGSVPAPLPVIGLRGMWRAMPDLYLEAQGQFFKAKVADIDGTISDLRAGATYMFTKNVGATLAYNSFKVDADVSRSSFNGGLNLGYRGLMFSLTAAF